jgi:hypothetical protein
MQKVAIFKPGRHTSSNGVAAEFSEADLQATIDGYDPSLHEAPVVIGHPADNGPAWGWVKALQFAEGELVADLDQVDPEFAEMVQAGRFKKRSASFYRPTAPSNPKPGIYYLRHVGFLGAQPPAIKGLREVQFEEDADQVVEFSEDTALGFSILARLMRGLRDTLLVKWGQADTDSALPGFLVEDLEAEARKARETPPAAVVPSFSEGDPAMTELETAQAAAKAAQAEVEALRAKAAEQEAALAQYAEAAAKAQQAERLAGFRAELQELVGQGRVLPAEVPQLAAFMAALDDAEAVAEFADAEGKAQTRLAYFRAQLRARPVAVDFTERAGGAADAVDMKATELAAKARALVDKAAAEGRTINYTEAVDQVLAGKAA